MRLKKTYSSREVAALTGLTARQLQLWDAGGCCRRRFRRIAPTAGGYTERRYTPIDLFELLVLADLRAPRLLRPAAARVVAVAERHSSATRLFDATGGGGAVQLLTDGREIYARTAAGDVFNLLKAPAQALLVVGDEGLLKELSGKVKREGRNDAKRISGSGRSSRGRRPAAE